MDFLRTISPAWIVTTGLVVSGLALGTQSLSPSQRGAALILFFLFASIALVVGLKWTNSEGVRDLHSGGVARITHDDSRRLAWSDWAILLTRAGSIDIRRQRLRLETRVFLGLISWDKVDRQLTTLDTVQAIHHYYETRDRDQRKTYVTYDHAVELHRAEGQPIRLFDLTTGRSDDASAALVDRLAGRINTAIRKV